MANFPSMPEHSRMRDMLMRFPERGAVLMHVAQQFLRGPSELTTAEREIVFAYGSALNGCVFCHTSHKYTAAELGVDEAMWDGVIADLDTAPIDDRLRALLRYVRKLTLTPNAMAANDVSEVLTAGWSEDALFDRDLRVRVQQHDEPRGRRRRHRRHRRRAPRVRRAAVHTRVRRHDGEARDALSANAG